MKSPNSTTPCGDNQLTACRVRSHLQRSPSPMCVFASDRPSPPHPRRAPLRRSPAVLREVRMANDRLQLTASNKGARPCWPRLQASRSPGGLQTQQGAQRSSQRPRLQTSRSPMAGSNHKGQRCAEPVGGRVFPTARSPRRAPTQKGARRCQPAASSMLNRPALRWRAPITRSKGARASLPPRLQRCRLTSCAAKRRACGRGRSTQLGPSRTGTAAAAAAARACRRRR